MELTVEHVKSAVYGGIFYGGGGGGHFDAGLALGKAAFDVGKVSLAEVDELPDDATVLCVSLVGSPADKRNIVSVEDFRRSIEVFVKNEDVRFAAFMSNENGAMATINGWIQAACTGVPVLNALANGRAHPTGVMGTMGLNRDKDYVSNQSAVGGARNTPNYSEGFFRGSIDSTSAIVRSFSSVAGGLVAVVRNPINIAYIKENAAIGALAQALRIGKVNVDALSNNPLTAAEKIAAAAGGCVVDSGIVSHKDLRIEGGFDYGKLEIACRKQTYSSIFWNEYLNLTCGDALIASFPDLVAFFDLDEMRCATSAEIAVGRKVAIIHVPGEQLKLGTGMFLEENYTVIRSLLGDAFRGVPQRNSIRR